MFLHGLKLNIRFEARKSRPEDFADAVMAAVEVGRIVWKGNASFRLVNIWVEGAYSPMNMMSIIYRTMRQRPAMDKDGKNYERIPDGTATTGLQAL